MAQLRTAARRGIALVAPPLCACCRRGCETDEWICAGCRAGLTQLPRGPVAAGAELDHSFAAFSYEGPARGAVAALKFRHAPAVARELAALMLPRLPVWAADGVLVPVPAHPRRLRERGYNQALLLATALGDSLGLPVVDCLRRRGSRAPQSSLSRAQRLSLPRGSIVCDAAALRQSAGDSLAEFPTKVVLCDDVSTTGVTLEVCAHAIRYGRLGAPQTLSHWGTVSSVAFAGVRAGHSPHPPGTTDSE